jgi:[glutamine synthetase] adenylyltransferase / [glutamine synthetase]-adenylyl-L-tyrosine phosphorylase
MNILNNCYFFPEASSPEDVARLLHQLREKIQKCLNLNQKQFLETLIAGEKGNKLLGAIFGNSPYLSQLLLKNNNFLHYILEYGFDQAFKVIIEEINNLPLEIRKEQLMAVLRVAKQKAALLIALADISKQWELEEVTTRLSVFAEVTIRSAVNYLLKHAIQSGEIVPEHNNNPNAGMIVLAVGKLGAGELNYSSDIDVIIFFDPEKVTYHGKKTLQQFFIKLSCDLVQIMQERTMEGYVFRTDLRLRPDPGSTPVAVSVQAAAHYYHTVGQNWERAALIKARPIAGDIAAGERFLKDVIKPFIWRRTLDFAAQEDIRSIKRQIDSKQYSLPSNLAGYNVKIGHGGIREIEFYVQTQQLIWGGRYAHLRAPATCDALNELVKAKRVEAKAAEELIAIYRYYRTLEHRLQMVEDYQTHSLPDTEEGLRRIAIFMGAKSTEAFIQGLLQKISTVKKHYGDLFSSSPSLGMEGMSLIFTGMDNDPETLLTIGRLGFGQAEMVSERIRGWHHGRYTSTQTKRARELLTELVPAILQSLGKTANPDTAFLKFDEFLSRVTDGIQLLSLLYAKPDLLTLIAEIMGSYPFLAENLSRKPALLDYVLSDDFLTRLSTIDSLASELNGWMRDAASFDEITDIAKRWTHERQFQVGVQLIRTIITPAQSRKSLSDIAEAVLGVLLDQTEMELAKKHGHIKGAEFVVVAMGKLGARNLTFRSDIDMVLIYNSPGEDDVSDGDEPLDVRQYYSRLSKKFISALTMLTAEGVLYKVDMRLRPSGKDGPVCSRLASIDRYFGNSAQTWEYMALTKARVITGNSGLAEEVTLLLQQKLQRQWDTVQLVCDVLETRQKIDQQYHSNDPWKIKYCRGGLIDVEFIGQFLQLRYGHQFPQLIDSNITSVFRKCGELGVIDTDTAKTLAEAAEFLFDLQSLLRLAYEGKLTENVKLVLTSALKKEQFSQVENRLFATESTIWEGFDRLVGK